MRVAIALRFARVAICAGEADGKLCMLVPAALRQRIRWPRGNAPRGDQNRASCATIPAYSNVS